MRGDAAQGNHQTEGDLNDAQRVREPERSLLNRSSLATGC